MALIRDRPDRGALRRPRGAKPERRARRSPVAQAGYRQERTPIAPSRPADPGASRRPTGRRSRPGRPPSALGGPRGPAAARIARAPAAQAAGGNDRGPDPGPDRRGIADPRRHRALGGFGLDEPCPPPFSRAGIEARARPASPAATRACFGIRSAIPADEACKAAKFLLFRIIHCRPEASAMTSYAPPAREARPAVDPGAGARPIPRRSRFAATVLASRAGSRAPPPALRAPSAPTPRKRAPSARNPLKSNKTRK